jgi:3-(3-hydroxy-phenyl)propionate hydroxylase
MISPVSDNGGIRVINATFDGICELPVTGAVSTPLLIRPNGHVAWVGQGGSDGLAETLRTLCGIWRTA